MYIWAPPQGYPYDPPKGYTGIWREWHMFGTRSLYAEYKNGVLDGKCKVWDSEGIPSFSANYKNGKLHGIFTYWNRFGKYPTYEIYINNEFRWRSYGKGRVRIGLSFRPSSYSYSIDHIDPYVKYEDLKEPDKYEYYYISDGFVEKVYLPGKKEPIVYSFEEFSKTDFYKEAMKLKTKNHPKEKYLFLRGRIYTE
jgi:hypothetical protein